MITSFIMIASMMNLNFQSAFEQSEKDEQQLTAHQNQLLIDSQGKAIGNAFGYCGMKYPQQKVSSFTIVVELDKSGKVVQTWNNQQTPFPLCIEKQIQNEMLFKPPYTPFFSSFEFQF